MDISSDYATNMRTKIEVHSFTCSWHNREYAQNLCRKWLRPCSLCCKIFNGLLFGWNLWKFRTNLKFVALPVPEIIGEGEDVGGQGWHHSKERWW